MRQRVRTPQAVTMRVFAVTTEPSDVGVAKSAPKVPSVNSLPNAHETTTPTASSPATDVICAENPVIPAQPVSMRSALTFSASTLHESERTTARKPALIAGTRTARTTVAARTVVDRRAFNNSK